MGKEKIVKSGNWYAVYTKPRFEKKVYAHLLERGVETYLPIRKVLKQWSDRKKWVEEPLFRSYIFIKTSLEDYYEILNTQGVVKFISFEGKPAIVQEKQIELLKNLLMNATDIEAVEGFFTPGDKVKVSAGPLMGLEGTMVDHKGMKKLLIRIEHLEYSLMITLPTAFVKQI